MDKYIEFDIDSNKTVVKKRKRQIALVKGQ
jgi:hypothetical protein